MSPSDLGFPECFSEFRPAQEEAIEYSLTSEKRFTALGAPPGLGKSLIAAALAKLLGGRTIILTATLGLQGQYQGMGIPGMRDIRGRSNYPCWEGGNCEDGGRLGCGDKVGCPYLSAFKAQQEADLVVTSYAYYLAVNAKGNGMRPSDTLICDEAGLADSWLSRSLDFTISERECREAKLKFAPTPGEDVEEWEALGLQVMIAAEARLAHVRAVGAGGGGSKEKYRRDLKHAEGFVDRANRIDRLDDNWVVSREDGTDEGRLWRFECIWPGRYRESLFQNIPRVILMSATLRPKTLGLLGIKRDECDFKEWGRQFPAANGPVIWLKTVRMKALEKMSGEDVRRWLDRHKEVMSARADRKGLDHTVSYERARQLAREFGKKYPIVLNGAADPETQTARQAYEQHLRGPKNSILISPSFSTGWDFKGPAAEYQILSKMPIPDTRSKIMQARIARDPTYPFYLCGQEFVQSCGRPVRDEKDRGESVLLDDSYLWLRAKIEPHIPKWFKVRKEEVLPPALPKINQ